MAAERGTDKFAWWFVSREGRGLYSPNEIEIACTFHEFDKASIIKGKLIHGPTVTNKFPNGSSAPIKIILDKTLSGNLVCLLPSLLQPIIEDKY